MRVLCCIAADSFDFVQVQSHGVGRQKDAVKTWTYRLMVDTTMRVLQGKMRLEM